MPAKDKVRKKYLKIRKNKYFSVKHSFFKPLLNLVKKTGKRRISLYYPSNYEVDTLVLLKTLSKKKKFTTLLPKILPNGQMKFVKWKFLDPLEVNKFGFLEPKVNSGSVKPDIIIMPILVFDKHLNRLGYGKGYYDKFLNNYINKQKKVLTIGLAFSFQRYKKLPISKFDVKLNYILTEKGIWNF